MALSVFRRWCKSAPRSAMRPRPLPLRLEVLENRLLPSLTPQLLKDINLTPLVTNPVDLVVVGATLFFSGIDAGHGKELWRSDGTQAGTKLVADINPGPGGSNPYYLTNVNGSLFFSA